MLFDGPWGTALLGAAALGSDLSGPPRPADSVQERKPERERETDENCCYINLDPDVTLALCRSVFFDALGIVWNS